MGDGIKGTIPCQLIGGPLDGAKCGDLPDIGGPMTGAILSVPLSQPAEAAFHAVYVCTASQPVDGLWPFVYERTDPPASVRLVEAPTGTSMSTTNPATVPRPRLHEVTNTPSRRSTMKLNALQLDRAVGAVLGSAAGDALGSQYEFGPSLADGTPVTFGRGRFGHAVGEWTDDTSMAMPILQVLARGGALEDSEALDEIVSRWLEWSRDALDVGTQTRHVLSTLRGITTADAATAAARRVHESTG